MPFTINSAQHRLDSRRKLGKVNKTCYGYFVKMACVIVHQNQIELLINQSFVFVLNPLKSGISQYSLLCPIKSRPIFYDFSRIKISLDDLLVLIIMYSV